MPAGPDPGLLAVRADHYGRMVFAVPGVSCRLFSMFVKNARTGADRMSAIIYVETNA